MPKKGTNFWLGITLGDPAGIGPEIIVKALCSIKKEDPFRYLILGDPNLVQFWQNRLGLSLNIQHFTDYKTPGRFFIHNPIGGRLSTRWIPGSKVSAQAAMAYLWDGAQRCLSGELSGLVTAPVNKKSIIRAGFEFVGQTEFLSEISQTKRTAMLLMGKDDRERWIRVVLVTTHLPLNEVSKNLTRAKVVQSIQLADEACRLLDLPQSRIAVCGLNPHAGEGGKLGREEIEIIRPAVLKAQKQEITVDGPFPADALFYQVFHGKYEMVVAMYHDQGLAPLKMIGFESGINWTVGLPFVRTSPDHGTAYDLAGKGQAHSGSMLAAIELARKLISRVGEMDGMRDRSQ